MPEIRGEVTFDHVNFSYDESKQILKDVSFTVKPGESVALVGPTGSGKSTIVNLISRFYNVNGGRVLIDGQDISQVTIHSLREQMGIMMQDSFIFSGDIEDNIVTENSMRHWRRLSMRAKPCVRTNSSAKCRTATRQRCASAVPC